MKERIGVYICHCGGNISDYVDVEELSKLLKDENGVVISKDVMFACADSNQKDMVKDIQDYNLDAIVVASCSPKLHLHTFKGVANRAGLNPSNYVQVNVREQCSWPHSDQPREATVKALGLIKAGIRRVEQSESLENIDITVKKSALVVGAGVAGMKAAIDLAQMGIEVYLLEKEYFVGGHITHNDKLFMSGQNGKEIVAKLYEQMKSYSNITLFTGAEIEKVSGSLGNFTIDISIRPRYFKVKKDTAPLLQAMQDCDVMVPDTFNYGLSQRKAIYKNYDGALPDIPVVDAQALKDHPDFVQKHAACIDLNQQPESISLTAGAVLVSTGFDHYKPKENEFGYGVIPQVVTIHEFNRMMEQSPERLIYNNKEITKVAFIYCVGMRQKKGENKYCSRTCCTSTIQTSIQLKEKYKDITAFHLYRDIRTYGKQELLYEKSSKQGDIYIRYDEKEPPVVEGNGKTALIKVKDYLTSKTELEIDADLVVLVTGMVSREDSQHISEKFKIPIGSDKFFNEIHPKLKPVETVIKGVYIGGSCQGPKNISESVQSSLSAAAKINALLKSGTISLDPIVARVNTDACLWCGKCAEVCEYTAIREIEQNGKHVAFVNKAICTGCGICAPVCPVNAIEIAQYTDAEIEGMIDGFMEQAVIPERSETTEEKSEETGVLMMKEFPQIWKTILASIDGGKKTIPQIAEELNINKDIVTYHMMTMNKYSVVMADGMDEKEAYYYYKRKY
ncbi:MAG TPA: CoB--CoM heterodisulfide reductase iron-sulfur subunit A family protein [Bacteroidales bacterium]|nr:CoB--CoM heterodisulfide reductase iron-sulfur subunit A family protein [Bacteroidales bacterium]